MPIEDNDDPLGLQNAKSEQHQEAPSELRQSFREDAADLDHRMHSLISDAQHIGGPFETTS